MSSFTTPLEFELMGSRLYRLTAAFEYHIGVENSGIVITVPAGFVTDLATVPRAFWSLFPPDGDYAKAAVIHDYLYQSRTVSRLYADEIFNEAMAVLGVHPLTRWLIFKTVRTFGGRYFTQ